jgi:hypothetical protein
MKAERLVPGIDPLNLHLPKIFTGDIVIVLELKTILW